MKLVTFQVLNYKVIDDTLPVKVDPRVTALVGKNESGKSSILRALWKSRNFADAKFDKLYDYPRDRYSRDRKDKQVATIITFELSEDDTDNILASFSRRPSQPPKTVTLTTFYDGEDKTGQEIAFDFEENRLGTDALPLADAVITALDAQQDATVAQAGQLIQKQITIDQPIWTKDNITALETFQNSISTWTSADATRSSKAQTERVQFDQLLAVAKAGNPWASAKSWVTTQAPAFIYFDDYGQLTTRIHLPTYLRLYQQKGNQQVRTQTALFEWSGIDPKEILALGAPRQQNEADDTVNRRLEKRRALLDSASFTLTGSWTQWWNEKRHKLHFAADGEDLVLNVSDEHNEFPIPFEERSVGFQWFFSFYLVFLVESEKAHKQAVLLLDEPGLHLHPTLQTKLIEFFERISDANQLIYSTHLPFLVDGNHLERVRTVHLAGPEPQKTTVSNDVRPTGDRDTLFPIQAALGYSIAQTLFLGRRSVIVEGITDYWIIKTLSTLPPPIGGTLHEDTIFIPAGGTSRLMPLASIMLASAGAQNNRLLVLLDSDKEGNDAAKRFDEAFQGESSVLMLGAAIGIPDATIEDLVPRTEYVQAINSLGYTIALNAQESAASTNLAALEQAFSRLNLGKFGLAQKAPAALYMIQEWVKDPTKVSQLTRAKAGALFDAINKKF